MDNQVILEFNEEIQGFHFNYIVDGKPQSPINTHGYQRLMICAHSQEADLFADFLHSQFREKGEKLTTCKALSTIDNLTNLIIAYNKYKL